MIQFMVIQKENIKRTFSQGLKDYIIKENDEQILSEAYELGRKLLQNGWGELDIIKIYHDSLGSLKEFDIDIREPEIMQNAAHYLSEWLAPYELRLTGYKDLVEETKEKNMLLEEEIEYRQKAEKSLQRNKKYYQSLIENAQDIITVLNYKKRIQYVSPFVKNMLGYEQEELTGKDAFRYFHPNDTKKVKQMFSKLVETKGQTYAEEFRFKHKDGHWVYLESVAKNVDNNPDEPMIVVNSRNITKRKRAMQELEEQSKQLAEAQRIAKVGSWKWIPDQDPELYWSKEMCRIYGVKPEKFDGSFETFWQYIHPDDLGKVQKEIDSALKKKGSMNFEHRIIINGKEKTLLCRGHFQPTDDDVQELKYIGTALDITEQKNKEKKLRQYSLRLRKLSGRIENAREEERISIARQIHDDLGQMLSVLKMDISLLFGSYAQKIKSEYEEMLQKETRHVIDRIDKIIISVQRITTELRPEVLDDLGLKEAIDWQAKQFGDRTGIKVNINAFDSEADYLNKEKSTTVFRIFQETLANITRHAQATSVNIDLHKDENNFYLIVNDNGIGITQKQLNNSSSLGIIGMRERSQLLGGDVDIEGNKEMGTTVTIRIPTDEAD